MTDLDTLLAYCADDTDLSARDHLLRTRDAAAAAALPNPEAFRRIAKEIGTNATDTRKVERNGVIVTEQLWSAETIARVRSSPGAIAARARAASRGAKQPLVEPHSELQAWPYPELEPGRRPGSAPWSGGVSSPGVVGASAPANDNAGPNP